MLFATIREYATLRFFKSGPIRTAPLRKSRTTLTGTWCHQKWQLYRVCSVSNHPALVGQLSGTFQPITAITWSLALLITSMLCKLFHGGQKLTPRRAQAPDLAAYRMECSTRMVTSYGIHLEAKKALSTSLLVSATHYTIAMVLIC